MDVDAPSTEDKNNDNQPSANNNNNNNNSVVKSGAASNGNFDKSKNTGNVSNGSNLLKNEKLSNPGSSITVKKEGDDMAPGNLHNGTPYDPVSVLCFEEITDGKRSQELIFLFSLPGRMLHTIYGQ